MNRREKTRYVENIFRAARPLLRESPFGAIRFATILIERRFTECRQMRHKNYFDWVYAFGPIKLPARFIASFANRTPVYVVVYQTHGLHERVGRCGTKNRQPNFFKSFASLTESSVCTTRIRFEVQVTVAVHTAKNAPKEPYCSAGSHTPCVVNGHQSCPYGV